VDEILGCSRRERCLPQPNTWLSTFHLPTNSSRRTGWQCGSLQPGSAWLTAAGVPSGEPDRIVG
jgi:hypothetical protein